MGSLVDFKQCLRVEANLDFEALDFIFIQPLKALEAWWQRQSDETKRYVTFFSGGLVGDSLKAFLKRIVGPGISTKVAAAFGEALGAIIVGIGLGLVIAAMTRCNIQNVDDVVI